MLLYRKNIFGLYKDHLNPPVADSALSFESSLLTEAPGVLQLHGVRQGPLLSLGQLRWNERHINGWWCCYRDQDAWNILLNVLSRMLDRWKGVEG